MQHVRSQRLLASLLLVAGTVSAETAVLRSGFRLQAERAEAGPGATRLLLANGGWIEVAAADLLYLEPGPSIPEEAPFEPSAAPEAEAPIPLASAIGQYADLHGVPAELVRAVVSVESGGRQDAVSAKGAIGLMQLMPGTAAALGVDPADVAGNLDGGVRYLREMLERYEGHQDQLVRALAAYNAGPGSVAEYGGLPPYRETVEYVAKVVRRFLDHTSSRSSDPHNGNAVAGTLEARNRTEH